MKLFHELEILWRNIWLKRKDGCLPEGVCFDCVESQPQYVVMVAEQILSRPGSQTLVPSLNLNERRI